MYGFELPIVFVRFLAVIRNFSSMRTCLVHYGPYGGNNVSRSTGAIVQNVDTGFLRRWTSNNN